MICAAAQIGVGESFWLVVPAEGSCPGLPRCVRLAGLVWRFDGPSGGKNIFSAGRPTRGPHAFCIHSGRSIHPRSACSLRACLLARSLACARAAGQRAGGLAGRLASQLAGGWMGGRAGEWAGGWLNGRVHSKPHLTIPTAPNRTPNARKCSSRPTAPYLRTPTASSSGLWSTSLAACESLSLLLGCGRRCLA